jgi:hypothetical protein
MFLAERSSHDLPLRPLLNRLSTGFAQVRHVLTYTRICLGIYCCAFLFGRRNVSHAHALGGEKEPRLAAAQPLVKWIRHVLTYMYSPGTACTDVHKDFFCHILLCFLFLSLRKGSQAHALGREEEP